MVRPLSKELQKKAIEELNEVPERVEEDIRTIQEWIEQLPYLNAPTDKQWILGFLRGCKFSLQITKDKIDTFFSAKTAMPETMIFKSVFSDDIQSLLTGGVILPLRNPKNYDGPTIMLMRYQYIEDRIGPESIVAVIFMMLTILMVEDDNLMVSGIVFWNDMTNLQMSFMLKVTPKILNNFFVCIQKGFPIRLKGLHYTGSLGIARKIVNLFKPLLRAKLRDRIVFYSAESFEEEAEKLQILTKRIIPEEYGGTNGSVVDLTSYWKEKVESYSDWFIENNKYRTDEAKRPGKSMFDDTIGIDGSFRKLNVD